MAHIRPSICVFALVLAGALAAAAPLRAQEAVFPAGSRIGIVPLAGLKAVEGRPGFESEPPGVKLMFAELPPDAFTSVDRGVKDNRPMPPNVPKPEGFASAAGPAYLSMEKAAEGGVRIQRYAAVVNGGAFAGYAGVEVTDEGAKTYPEDAIRRMLATLTLRKEVPVEEQLALLPFKVSDLAGFKTVRMLAPNGAAVLIADGAEDGGLGGAPYMVVSLAPVAPGPNDDRGRLAQQLAASIPGIRDARIVNSEPVRISGSPGYEVRIEATAVKEDRPITVVQWLRFGAGSTLRIVAGSTRQDWTEAFPRFRAVRDGIGPKEK